MKHASLHTALCSAIGAVALLIPCARADVPGINMDFEDYELGELLGQGFWGAHPGWVNSWEIVDHEGPDGTMTRCLATTELSGSSWPRAETTFTTADLTKYGWPTKGKFRVSFDFLFDQKHAVTLYFLGTNRNYVFQMSYNVNANSGKGRMNTSSGQTCFIGLTDDINAGNPTWHHFEADVDYTTDTYTMTADGVPVANGAAQSFQTSSETLGSFGKIVLQTSFNPGDASGGFYMDNIRIYRTDVDPSEITVVVFR